MKKIHHATCYSLRLARLQAVRFSLGKGAFACATYLLFLSSPLLATDTLPVIPEARVSDATAILPNSILLNTLGQHQGRPKVYRVMPGDTLWGIAEQYFGNTEKWSFIQDTNAINDPSRLRPGTLLDLEEKDAFPVSVRYLFGDAWQIEGGDKQVLEQGEVVKEGATVETGRGASLTLETSDGSRVVVPSNTRVVVKREREFGIQLVLEKGEVDSRIIPRDNKNRPFNIETDSGVLGVRGTRFITEATDQATLSSVYEGSVAAQAGQQRVELARINSGEGARAGNDGSLEVVKLLAPPEVLSVATMIEGELVVAVKRSDRAYGYQVVISRDAEGLESVAVERTTSSPLVLKGLAEGNYFLRVAAIDELGVVGQYRQQAIEHRSEGVSISNEGDAWRISWRRQSSHNHALEMAMNPSFNKVMLRYKPVSSGAISLRDLPDEELFWRVVRLDDDGDVANVIDSGLVDVSE